MPEIDFGHLHKNQDFCTNKIFLLAIFCLFLSMPSLVFLRPCEEARSYCSVFGVSESSFCEIHSFCYIMLLSMNSYTAQSFRTSSRSTYIIGYLPAVLEMAEAEALYNRWAIF